MTEQQLEMYWNDLPIGRDKAASYDELCELWGKGKRVIRGILHELSYYDNGDDMILIRSSMGKGFYKTDDHKEIARYRQECLSRGKRTFAPLRKIDRVLKPESGQLSMTNNLKAIRVSLEMKQSEVCDRMKAFHPSFDEIMLSKMENGKCFPTPLQLAHLAAIYGCEALDLVDINLYAQLI